jgi:hypothetical protein
MLESFGKFVHRRTYCSAFMFLSANPATGHRMLLSAFVFPTQAAAVAVVL